MVSRGSNRKPNLLFESFGNTARASSLETARVVGKKSWILHQGNAPAHNVLSVKRYLAAKGTPVLEHVAFSSDLAHYDFFLFPKIKSALKRNQFESMEEVKQKLTELLNAFTKEDFQHCFEQWEKQMEQCVSRRGEYIKGEHSIVEWFLK